MAQEKRDHGLEAVLTVAEVAEALAVSRQTVYSMMARGDLPFVRLRPERRKSQRRVKVSDVRRIIEGGVTARRVGQAAGE